MGFELSTRLMYINPETLTVAQHKHIDPLLTI